VIRFFTLKGLKARVIYTKLESVSGPEALTLLTVQKWRRRFYQGRMDLFDDPRSERPLTEDCAGAVGSILEERPFSSSQGALSPFPDWKGDVLADLHDKLGLKK
jgi:hypothetical protein